MFTVLCSRLRRPGVRRAGVWPRACGNKYASAAARSALLQQTDSIAAAVASEAVRVCFSAHNARAEPVGRRPAGHRHPPFQRAEHLEAGVPGFEAWRMTLII